MTSSGSILELETLNTKMSLSPYKNLKLPALTSKKRLHDAGNHTKLPSVREKGVSRNNISVHSSASKHSKYSKKALDMTTEVDYDKVIGDTTSLHELIILTLSTAFGAKPRQAASLLPQSFKFLTVAVVKGNKKESKSIRRWFKMINKVIKHLVDVILNDNPQRIESQIYNTLNVLKVGLFSTDDITIRLCMKSFHFMITEFTKTFYQGFFWEWLKREDQVLKAIVHIFLDYPSQDKIVWEFLVKIAYNHLEELFMKHIFKVWDSNIYKYIETLHDMMMQLQSMSDDSPEIESFFLSGLIQNNWIDYLIYQLNNDASDPNSIKQLWWTFLGDIITTFKCDRGKVDKTIQALNMAARTAFHHQQITAFTVLFHILSKFANNKNPSASVIYKILSGYIASYHYIEETREFLLSNMSQMIKDNQTMPLEIVLLPLMKEIKRFIDDTYYFNAFDFQFFMVVAAHKKCNLTLAVKLCKLFAHLSVK